MIFRVAGNQTPASVTRSSASASRRASSLLAAAVVVGAAFTSAVGAGCSGDDASSSPKDRIRCRGDTYIGDVHGWNPRELKELEGVECIQGSVFLGAEGCRGAVVPLKDLSAFESVKVIEGELAFSRTSGDLRALKNLRRVRRLSTCASPDLVVNLPKLVATSLALSSTKEISLPSLEVAPSIRIQLSDLSGLEFPKLKTIERELVVQRSEKIQRIDLPALTSVGGIELKHLPRFSAFEAQKLAYAGGVEINDIGSQRDQALDLSFLARLSKIDGALTLKALPTLATLAVPEVLQISGDLEISGADKLTTIDLQKLERAGSIEFTSLPALRTAKLGALSGPLKTFLLVDTPKLGGEFNLDVTEVRKDVRVVNTRITQLTLPKLTSVRGDIVIERNPVLSRLLFLLDARVGKGVAIRENPKVPVTFTAALEVTNLRLDVCGTKGTPPCKFEPPRLRFEPLPTSLRLIRIPGKKAFASERADTAAGVAVLSHLAKKDKKAAKSTPTIYVRSRVSDAVVVVRGKNGRGPIKRWLWLRPVPGRGYVTLATGRPSRKERLEGLRVFVDIKEAVVLAEKKRRNADPLVVAFRAERGKKAKFQRLGSLDVTARARSHIVAKRGISGASVGRRGRVLEISFEGGDAELPLVFQYEKKRFSAVEIYRTALRPGESRAEMIRAEAVDEAVSDELPAAEVQTVATATATLGACKSLLALPECPKDTHAVPAGPPKSNFVRCRLRDGTEEGPSVQWFTATCKPGEPLMVRRQGSYREGKKHGVWTSWSTDGTPVSQVTWRDGKQTGFTRQYDAKGVTAEGTAENTRRIGSWRVRAKNGRMRTKKY